MFEKSLMIYQILLDPPKYPLRRRTLIQFSPFLRAGGINKSLKSQLNTFQTTSNSLNVLQVNNGLFHKAKRLQIPENMVWLKQQHHSPELNSIERIWQHLKQDFKWELFNNLESWRTKVAQLLADLIAQIAASSAG